jgi:hypothetical protein
VESGGLKIPRGALELMRANMPGEDTGGDSTR